MTRSAAIRLLKREMKKAGGLRAFGRLHGISISTLSEVANGKQPPTRQVRNALGLGLARTVIYTYYKKGK